MKTKQSSLQTLTLVLKWFTLRLQSPKQFSVTICFAILKASLIPFSLPQVLDRLCLITFTLFTIIATLAVLAAAPHVIVKQTSGQSISCPPPGKLTFRQLDRWLENLCSADQEICAQLIEKSSADQEKLISNFQNARRLPVHLDGGEGILIRVKLVAINYLPGKTLFNLFVEYRTHKTLIQRHV